MDKKYCELCDYFMETADRVLCLKYFKDLHNVDCQKGIEVE